MNFPIGKGTIPSNTFGLADTGSGLILGNMDYHQSVADCHPNLVLQFLHLKDLDNMDSFNRSGLDRGMKSKKGKLGVDVTELVMYKNNFVVSGQPVTSSFALGKGVACNTTF